MPDFKSFVRQHLSSHTLPLHREQKIVEELAAQLEESYDALIGQGLADQDAWNELRRQMPDGSKLRHELLAAEPIAGRLAQSIRATIGFDLGRDLQSSLRLLVKNRGFALTTILTLAVCLGANAAIFTVVYGVLLRPLPVPDAHRIVVMGDVYPTITPNDILSNTVPSYFDRLKAVSTLEEQAMFSLWFDTLILDGIPQEMRGMRATPSLFRVLQVNPALGRVFTEWEGESGADRKIILSHGLWQRLYGGDPTVIGRELRLGWTGQGYTIVGVMPRGFSFFDLGDDGHAPEIGDAIQFWIPLAFTAAQKSDDSRTRYGFFHIGRLRSEATVEQVRAQIDALNAANFKRFPQFGFTELGMYTAVTPLRDALTRDVSGILYLLWGGAAFVLLIGALNLTNLTLARASVRARELATRLALGASRVRVTRQLIVEGVVLAGIGGLASLAVAAWILRTLTLSGMANLPNAASVQIDSTVAGFTAALSLLVGVLIGFVSSIKLQKGNLNQILTEGNRLGTGGRAAHHLRQGLVVAQVAFSIVLLIGAAVLLSSFRNLLAVDAGFDAQRVITGTIFPPPSRYKEQRDVVAVSDRILQSIRNIPGVQVAGITSNIALSGRSTPATVSPADDNRQPGDALVLPSVVSVTPGYFEAMGTPIVRGRYFNAADREDTLRVAILDERLAARLWPNQDPIGKAVRRGASEPYTVVGVVGGVRFEGLAARTESVGAAYFPHTQAPPLGRLRWIAVKSATESAALTTSLRASIMAIDPDLPLSDIQTMTQRMSGSVVPQKLAMGLASMFGVVALFLSLLGLYGVLAYAVAQKRREIGIRVALGSTPRRIFEMIFREGLTLVAAGLTLGVVGAIALGRTLEGQVFGVTPTDPFVLSAVTVATGIVALLACVSPAYGATRVDPVNVLIEQ